MLFELEIKWVLMRTIGGGTLIDFAGSFGRSSGMVKTSEALESKICFDISWAVLSGLAVVMTAPRDMTERQTIGKKTEFGESTRTT